MIFEFVHDWPMLRPPRHLNIYCTTPEGLDLEWRLNSTETWTPGRGRVTMPERWYLKMDKLTHGSNHFPAHEVEKRLEQITALDALTLTWAVGELHQRFQTLARTVKPYFNAGPNHMWAAVQARKRVSGLTQRLIVGLDTQ